MRLAFVVLLGWSLAADEAPLRTLNSGFPMKPVADIADWPARRAEIRTRILVAAGLHPMPVRSPLKPIVHGKVDRPGYSVERVILESFPGHFLTGSLYRPKGVSGKRPGLLSPHGHWKEGRFYDHGEARVKQEIAASGERFKLGGSHPIQARCVQLARMGCIVFVYDMEGYADSVQLEHRCAPGRGPDLLGSPQAELQGQTIFGLQTWNSVRALDFLSALPDVDPARIGVTGASGGGTQSMVISALDDRIAAAFPAVMVSEGMQGGCTCENASHLRISQGNIDIAAATAPRPLGLIAANDWTKALETKGHPQLSSLYARLGAESAYEAHFHIQFTHNYNTVNRQHLYHFVNRHFALGLSEPIEERDYQPLAKSEASVWTAVHPKPTGDQVGDAHERQLLKSWKAATAAAWSGMRSLQRRKAILEGLFILTGPHFKVFELPNPASKARLTISGKGNHDYQRSLCYTYGYNRPPLAGIRSSEYIDFDFASIDRLDHPMLLPGISRYLPVMRKGAGQ